VPTTSPPFSPLKPSSKVPSSRTGPYPPSLSLKNCKFSSSMTVLHTAISFRFRLPSGPKVIPEPLCRSIFCPRRSSSSRFKTVIHSKSGRSFDGNVFIPSLSYPLPLLQPFPTRSPFEQQGPSLAVCPALFLLRKKMKISSFRRPLSPESRPGLSKHVRFPTLLSRCSPCRFTSFRRST